METFQEWRTACLSVLKQQTEFFTYPLAPLLSFFPINRTLVLYLGQSQGIYAPSLDPGSKANQELIMAIPLLLALTSPF